MPEPDTLTLDGARLGIVLDRTLRMFGDAGRQYIMDDLASHGIKFDGDSRYSLEQVRKALSIIGDDGASLVIDRLRKEMGIA